MHTKMKTKDLVLCSLMTSLIVIISQININLPGGIPFTLQTFAILLSGHILGAKRGTMSVIVYVLLGAFGLPVFTQFSGGFHVLFGPTGGYILSFPAMAFAVGYIAEKTNYPIYIFISMLVAVLVNLLCGTLMFMGISGISFSDAFVSCFLPFIFTGILKAILATAIGCRIKSLKEVSL